MSNVGQGVLDVIGLALTIYTGNPAFFLAAEAAGQVLFPTQQRAITGPRLTDHQTTTSALGDPVIIGYGTFPTTGTVIFLAQVVEHASTTGGGKSGPKQTSYSYTQSIAIGLCETTSMGGTNNPILGIQRIWEDGQLVYDTRPLQTGEDPTDYSKRIAANVKYAATFVLYTGTETQGPDPTIELQQGVGTTPSFRGLAYIVYPDRLLQINQGQRHPTFKFEVLASGNSEQNIVAPVWLGGSDHSSVQIDMLAVDNIGLRYYVYNAATGNWAIDAFDMVSNTQIATATSTTLPGFGASGNVSFYMSPDGVLIANWLTGGSSALIARLDPSTLAVLASTSSPPNMIDWKSVATLTVNFGAGNLYYMAIIDVLGHLSIVDCVSLSVLNTFTYTDHPRVCAGLPESGNGVFWIAANTPSAGPSGGDIHIYKVLITNSGSTSTLMCTITAANIDAAWGYIQTFGDFALSAGDGHVILRVLGPIGATHAAYIIKFNPQTGVIDWTFAVTSGANYDYAVNQSYAFGESFWIADNTPGFTHYYDINVATGAVVVVDLSGMPGMLGMIGATATLPSLLGGAVLAPQSGGAAGWSLILPHEPISGNVQIADIVADLCNRSGLTDHDTSSLGAETVEGYTIASTPMAARDAIVPLRSVGFFDSVESGDVLRFVKRGGAPALTLGVTDIGAYDDSQSSDDPPAANSVAVAMESDLPQQIRVSYMAPLRDYQPGQQLSPVRYDTLSQNILDVQIGGVCISDEQAAQVAEILWNDAWESDHTFTFAVDMSKAALEPTDVVLVPLQGTLFRVRIITIDDASQIMRTITAVTDDDGNYTSSAVAQTPPVKTTMKLQSASGLIILDSPLLRDADDTGRVSAPIYSAVYKEDTSSWTGAGIYNSDDGGTTYLSAATATNPVDTGLATSVLAATAEPFVTDTVNSVTVQMTAASTLPSSITGTQLLAGGNAAALIDADGSIEIFQFRDVDVVSADTVTLSYLLRGRRGSEAMMGSHAVGSRFLMLGVPMTQTEDLNLHDLTRLMEWKAVGVADTLDSVTAVPFTSSGRSLMPRAPWNTRTTLDGFNDMLIMADRRSRIENDSPISFASPTLALNEDMEAYQVDIYDAPGTSILRTLSGTSLPITYHNADILTDFGSVPATIWLAVYQMSAQVGRGFTHKVNVGVPT